MRIYVLINIFKKKTVLGIVVFDKKKNITRLVHVVTNLLPVVFFSSENINN